MASASTKQRISDEAVKKATGCNWKRWFDALDAKKAKGRDHKEITAIVQALSPKLDGWWVQMVTVAYEQHTGARVAHQKAGGFEISASKTIHAPLSKVYGAWANARSRATWLPEPIEITTSTKDKSVRARFGDGQTRVSVEFYAKGDNKCQVALQHMKLGGEDEALEKKAFWKDRLADLKTTLEG